MSGAGSERETGNCPGSPRGGVVCPVQVQDGPSNCPGSPGGVVCPVQVQSGPGNCR